MPEVLFIEDSRAFQRLMTKYLPEGFGLTTVETLSAAEDAIHTRAFDLLISDFVFPEGDALQLIFKIRREFPPDKLPVIVLSSSADRYLISKCFSAGVNATVAKPPNVPLFRELVTRMIEAPWVQRPEPFCEDACLVAWAGPVEAFVYCPNLDIRTSGPTPEAALKAMTARLHEYQRSGAPVPVITGPRQTVHFLPKDPAPPA